VKQQTNFWTKRVTEPGSLSKKSAPPSTPLAIYMTECEAREWKSRYKQKIKQLGKVKAQSWWLQVKADILRIRGQDSLNILIAELNRDANTLSS
jgi:hypothetical protein